MDIIIPGDALNIDLDKTRNTLITSYNEAFALSLEIAYPTTENTTILLQTAHQEAFILSLNAAIPNKANIADLIKKAHTEMLSLKNLTEKSS